MNATTIFRRVDPTIIGNLEPGIEQVRFGGWLIFEDLQLPLLRSANLWRPSDLIASTAD